MGDKNQSGVEKQSIVKGQRKRRATTQPTRSAGITSAARPDATNGLRIAARFPLTSGINPDATDHLTTDNQVHLTLTPDQVRGRPHRSMTTKLTSRGRL